MQRDILEIRIRKIIEYSKIGCRVNLKNRIRKQNVCGRINSELPCNKIDSSPSSLFTLLAYMLRLKVD